MKDMTNYIKFEDDKFQRGRGLISTLDRDVLIEVEPFTSANVDSPTHKIFSRSPGKYRIDIGGIWKKLNRNGEPYFTSWPLSRPG